MIKFLSLLFACFIGSLPVSAQEKPIPQLYAGTVDGKLAITMFLLEQAHDCTGKPLFQGIYKYNKNPGTDDWLLLNIDSNENGQFVMVEVEFSGVMILRKTGDTFTGIWIHPDGKKQLKVELKKQPFPAKEVEKYLEYLESTNHRYFDC